MKTILIFLLVTFLNSITKSQNLYFPPINSDVWETFSPKSLNWCNNEIEEFYKFLETSNTKAFILLKDGKIVLEQYFGKHTKNSMWYWASAGKTLTAFLVGIAQQEKYLSIDNQTSNYLGQGWTSCSPEQENKITIKNQLSMTCGFDDSADLSCTEKNCLTYQADAGKRWSYHNAPYTLLDDVLTNSTGMRLNLYNKQKIKNTTGISGVFIKKGDNNVYFSNARSMARFGLLILNKGNWNGNQILKDSMYFKQMTTSSQNINNAYGYFWWLNGQETYMVPHTQIEFKGNLCPYAPEDMIAAIGKNGQFINVVPSQNLVWIRMGDAPEGLDIPFKLNNLIWKYINNLYAN